MNEIRLFICELLIANKCEHVFLIEDEIMCMGNWFPLEDMYNLIQTQNIVLLIYKQILWKVLIERMHMNSDLYYAVCKELHGLEDDLILDANGKIVKGNAKNKELLIQIKCWDKMKNYLYIYSENK